MNLNTLQFSKVVETAKSKTNDKRWINAIDRASEAILSGDLVITELMDYSLVTSPNGSYRVNGHCECRAAQRGHSECYHRAGVRLMALYHEAERESVTTKVTEKAPSRSDLIEDIKRTWKDRFPTINLGDELMSRFKRNSLEMLSVDFLMAIRAVIA
jgi:hypothetical protein